MWSCGNKIAINLETCITFQDFITLLGLVNQACLHSLQSRGVRLAKKEVLGMSTITYKFQVTIPKKVREKHHIKEGDTLMFVEENDRIYIGKSTEV